MAHYAKLDSANLVTDINVVDNDVEDAKGEAGTITWLLNGWGGDSWIKTSYNGNLHNRYAHIGDTYDAAKEMFIAPKPFASWTLIDATGEWEAPLAEPADVETFPYYYWDESAYQADNTTGWVANS